MGAILCWVLFAVFASLSWNERSRTGHRLTTLAGQMETACKAGKAREVPPLLSRRCREASRHKEGCLER